MRRFRTRLRPKLQSKNMAEIHGFSHNRTILYKLPFFNMLTIRVLASLGEISGCLRVLRFTLSRNYEKNFSHIWSSRLGTGDQNCE